MCHPRIVPQPAKPVQPATGQARSRRRQKQPDWHFFTRADGATDGVRRAVGMVAGPPHARCRPRSDRAPSSRHRPGGHGRDPRPHAGDPRIPPPSTSGWTPPTTTSAELLVVASVPLRPEPCTITPSGNRWATCGTTTRHSSSCSPQHDITSARPPHLHRRRAGQRRWRGRRRPGQRPWCRRGPPRRLPCRSRRPVRISAPLSTSSSSCRRTVRSTTTTAPTRASAVSTIIRHIRSGHSPKPGRAAETHICCPSTSAPF